MRIVNATKEDHCQECGDTIESPDNLCRYFLIQFKQLSTLCLCSHCIASLIEQFILRSHVSSEK